MIWTLIFRPEYGDCQGLIRVASYHSCAVSAAGALVTCMDNHSYDLPLALVIAKQVSAACGTRFMTGAKRRWAARLPLR